MNNLKNVDCNCILLPSIKLISENPDLKKKEKRTDFNTSSAIAT